MTDPHDDLADRVAATRAQLFDTLDAIEDKLNVPKQIGIAASSNPSFSQPRASMLFPRPL